MNVSELAKCAEVTPGVVRYYTRLDLLKADKLDNGYHDYNQTALRDLRFISKAKRLGLTLNEIKTILQHAENGLSPCQEVRLMLERRLNENQQKINRLIKLQSRMEMAMEQWAMMPDSLPGQDSICLLIESVE